MTKSQMKSSLILLPRGRSSCFGRWNHKDHGTVSAKWQTQNSAAMTSLRLKYGPIGLLHHGKQFRRLVSKLLNINQSVMARATAHQGPGKWPLAPMSKIGFAQNKIACIQRVQPGSMRAVRSHIITLKQAFGACGSPDSMPPISPQQLYSLDSAKSR